ncbi:hypothetical protein ACGFNP_20820 [Nonomuraea sp. NPDC049269]|uniref:hypothetical protein n=1 Tax=Nonomuraea sp. NPDC049269 TaxID=3364349 RepID=UPI0037240929
MWRWNTHASINDPGLRVIDGVGEGEVAGEGVGEVAGAVASASAGEVAGSVANKVASAVAGVSGRQLLRRASLGGSGVRRV